MFLVKYYAKGTKFHRKYGDMVRVAPNDLSCTDDEYKMAASSLVISRMRP
jgi:hypothetical protein